MKRLSGDQNGRPAPSVPSSGCALSALSARIQIRFFPVESVALNARMRPSGEIRGASIVVISGGVGISNRTSCARAGARRTNPIAKPAATRAAAAARPHASFSRLFRLWATGAGSPACDPPSAIHWSCSLTSCAVWKRFSGSFERHVAMARSSAGGVMGAIDETDGGFSLRIAPMRLAWLFPSKAFFPVAISKRTAPRAKMSLRASASPPSSCSGAMYWNVPRIVPCWVRCWGEAIVGSDVSWVCAACGASVLARPKSSSLTPPFVSITLPGLRSRWTIPCRCARSRASAIWIPAGISCPSSIGPFARRLASVSPSRYSMTRYSVPSCEPTS